MVTIKELQKSIAEERKKIKRIRSKDVLAIKKSQLQKELFKLKHRKAISTGGKGARLLRQAGKGLIKTGKKAAPIIKKQARLIREQQLRDEALERALKKKRKKPEDKKTSQGIDIFKGLDF